MSTPRHQVQGFDFDDDRPWYRAPKFIAAAAALVLVVVAAVFLIARGDGRDPALATDGAGPEASALTAAPAGTTWTLFYGIALPNVPGAMKIKDDVPVQFAHSPEGALVAASNLTYRAFVGPSWEQVLTKYTVGASKSDSLDQARSIPDHTDTSNLVRFAAFKFQTYTDTAAQIELVNGRPSTYKSALVTLLWQDNDWRVSLYGDGALSAPATRVYDLTDYVPWSGVAQ